MFQRIAQCVKNIKLLKGEIGNLEQWKILSVKIVAF
jgi:hypothetical protein